MRIGVDFDNTIVRYEDAFHQAAVERGLIPPTLRASKERIRDYLRQQGHELKWTELQGYVYGPGMAAAEPYPGVLDCLACWLHAGVAVFIISHKTRFPYAGPAYDLHAATWRWLERHRFYEPGLGLPRENVFLESTRQEKLHRVAAAGCTHFIDDLPEFLGEPEFPDHVAPILFDPHGVGHSAGRCKCLQTWADIKAWLPANSQIREAGRG